MGFNRNFFLRLMIYALVCAGLLSVLGIVTGSWEIVGRVICIALIVGGGAGLMLPVSGWMDDRRNFVAGVLGMSVILAQVFCFAGVVLLFNWWSHTWALVWRLLLVGLLLAPTGWPLAIMLRGQTGWRMPVQRLIAVLVFPATFLIGFISIMADLFFPQWAMPTSSWFDAVQVKLSVTGTLLWGLGILGMMSMTGWSAQRRQYWKWVGLICAFAAFFMVTYGVWAEIKSRSSVFEIVVCIAVFIAYTSCIMELALKPSYRFVRHAAVVMAGVMLALSCYHFVEVIDLWNNIDLMAAKLMLASTIITGVLTFTLLILARLSRGANVDLSEPEVTAIETPQLSLTCPRCQLTQKLELGESHCRQCYLRFTIEMEEPRCTKCGFLLYKCTSENCPECGTPIRTAGAVQG